MRECALQNHESHFGNPCEGDLQILSQTLCGAFSITNRQLSAYLTPSISRRLLSIVGLVCVLFANCPGQLIAQSQAENTSSPPGSPTKDKTESATVDSEKSSEQKSDIWSEVEKPIHVEKNLVFRKIDGQEIKADLLGQQTRIYTR